MKMPGGVNGIIHGVTAGIFCYIVAMDDIDIMKFKQRLQERREQLLALEQTADSAAQTVQLDQSKVGRVSRMDAMQAQAMSVETRRRRQLELKKIAVALNRIKDDEYGYCISCGEEIDPRRLLIDLSASLCIRCAENNQKE